MSTINKGPFLKLTSQSEELAFEERMEERGEEEEASEEVSEEEKLRREINRSKDWGVRRRPWWRPPSRRRRRGQGWQVGEIRERTQKVCYTPWVIP